MSWSQARDAARAAWDRVGRSSYNSAYNSGAAADSTNDDVIVTLNNLIETCRDGEYGFNACAEHATALQLQTVFRQRGGECRDAAAELRGLVTRLGGKPVETGTAAGALHRGWVAVRGTLSGYSDQAILDECERGEDKALGSYRKALKQTLPGDIRAVVKRQMDGAQKNHDQIKALRDQQKGRASP